MDDVILVSLLNIFLHSYENGDFLDIKELLSNNCTWESDWWSERRESSEDVIKYYQKKGALINRSGCFPSGYVVTLYGADDHIEGKGIYLYQVCDNVVSDLVLRLSLDEQKRILSIKLQMKELYRMRRFYADCPQF